ncbi:MAG: PAS domain-containing protein [Ferrovibrio sp.]
MAGGAEQQKRRAARAFEHDATLSFWNSRPAGFVKLWQSRVPAGLHIPPRRLLQAEDLRDFLAYIIVVDMDESRTRYRNRLIGTEVTAQAGRDVTGKWLDEIYPPTVLDGHIRAHQWVIENRQPLRVHGTMEFVDRGYMPIEAAVVPLSLERADYVEQFMICTAYGELQTD